MSAMQVSLLTRLNKLSEQAYETKWKLHPF